MSELRLAVRRVLRSPGYALTAVLTIALAIGANAGVYSAVRGLLDRPLPFRDADDIVWIDASTGTGDARTRLNVHEADALAQSGAFQAVGVIGDRSFVRRVGDVRTRWRGLWVTPGMFDVLGIRPVAGRALTLADAREGARVMMMSYERWQQDFGGDPAIIGRPLQFTDNHEFIVVGILPQGLRFPLGELPQSGNGAGLVAGVQDFWLLGQSGDGLPGGLTLARLQSDLAVAQQQAAAVSLRLAGNIGAEQSDRVLSVTRLRAQTLGMIAPALKLAQAFALLTLVLACANLANLTLLRTITRQREFAVTAALGANAHTLIRGVIAEALVVTAAGGAIGLALASFARNGLRLVAADTIPLLDGVRVDSSVVLFTLAMTAVVALVLGPAPSS